MTKILNGSELVGYIKERQARQVRALRQGAHISPRLVIIKSKTASPVIDTYLRMKGRYGDDILIETIVLSLDETDMIEAITKLNDDPEVHGVMVQLPLDDSSNTDDILKTIAPEKDVDGLGPDARFDSATAKAINWLLAGYAIELKAKKITIVGNGRLVGGPLAHMWRESGFDVTVLTRNTEDIASILRQSDVIVTATGVPHLITSEMIPIGSTVVDAGTASEDGLIVGDIDETVRARDDLTITPEKGGVGPLTVAALFDNVITAAQTAGNRLL
ncbi:MAG: putative Methylenetetrahydrofolate dehydrogenase [Candidatus Saccharibacteria bacterium]|nr:putative Methylenetetrahydrofolate dehydrogenase [Candidatus Saccharibacteria bacterium]